MRRFGIKSTLLAAVTVGALIVVSTAFAGFPHFKAADTSITFTTSGSGATALASLAAAESGSGGSTMATLNISFREVGLGSAAVITYTASATASATYACINGGSKNPSASNKRTVVAPASASGPFTATQSGAISGALTIDAPAPGSFSCPPGQSLKLYSVAFTGIVLTDTTNGVSINLADTSANAPS